MKSFQCQPTVYLSVGAKTSTRNRIIQLGGHKGRDHGQKWQWRKGNPFQAEFAPWGLLMARHVQWAWGEVGIDPSSSSSPSMVPRSLIPHCAKRAWALLEVK
jgi:hypothetical protein